MRKMKGLGRKHHIFFVVSSVSSYWVPTPHGQCPGLEQNTPPPKWKCFPTKSGVLMGSFGISERLLCPSARSCTACGAGAPLQLPGPGTAGTGAPRLPAGQQHPEPPPGSSPTLLFPFNHIRSLCLSLSRSAKRQAELAPRY